MRYAPIIAIGAAALAAAAPAQAARHFSPNVTNPWYPLKPGTVYSFRGEEDGVAQSDIVRVTHRTKLIAGFRARVVRDRVFKHGRVVEDTRDYFAQDRRGTVWYVGEDTAELDRHGRVTTREGTWRTGRHGGEPGIIMPAHPRVGFAARQEYLKGHAEDHFKIVSRRTSVSTPYGRFRHVLVTKEWSPLEKGVVDHKYYVRGIGVVAEKTIRGGNEIGKLVSITHG